MQAAIPALLRPPVGVYSPLKTMRQPPGAPAAPSDLLLLARIAEGDLEAFQAFYDRYAGRVLAYVRQLSRHRDGAEDVVQEVFVAVWRRAASYRPDRGDPMGWLYTITRNKQVDLWRRQGETRPQGLAGAAGPEPDDARARRALSRKVRSTL